MCLRGTHSALQAPVQRMEHLSQTTYVGFDRRCNLGIEESNVGGDHEESLKLSCRATGNIDEVGEFCRSVSGASLGKIGHYGYGCPPHLTC